MGNQEVADVTRTMGQKLGTKETARWKERQECLKSRRGRCPVTIPATRAL